MPFELVVPNPGQRCGEPVLQVTLSLSYVKEPFPATSIVGVNARLIVDEPERPSVGR